SAGKSTPRRFRLAIRAPPVTSVKPITCTELSAPVSVSESRTVVATLVASSQAKKVTSHFVRGRPDSHEKADAGIRATTVVWLQRLRHPPQGGAPAHAHPQP